MRIIPALLALALSTMAFADLPTRAETAATLPLHLHSARSVDVQILPDGDRPILALNNAPFVIQSALEPYSLRAADFRAWAATSAGLVEVAAPPPQTYRSISSSLKIAASVEGQNVTAVIEFDQELYYLQPTESGGHVLYGAEDLAPGDWSCGLDALASDVPVATPGDGGVADGGCLKRARVAFDADYEFYQLNGSDVAQTVADIEGVMNAVEFIYVRDGGVVYEIGDIVTWTDPNDPYAATSSGSILDEFRVYWLANFGAIQRDVAHMMTGRDPSGSVIGVAYLGGVCNPNIGFGYSQSRFTNNFAFRVSLTAHELGHNWSAPHCNVDPDCAIMCSGIGGCTGSVTQFGQRSMASISNWANAVGCLQAAPGYPSPLGPRARDDSATTAEGQDVLIDVLANDHDGNCDPLDIASFAPISAAGATITLSIGTGPGGRNELRYTPAGPIETDTLSYTITDGITPSSATVRVKVLTLRVPDSIGVAVPGVAVDYYELRTLGLPNYDKLTPFTTKTAATINYPAAQNNIVGSGRPNFVGARFEGALSLSAGGLYTFYITSDDGSALYVNEQLVIAHDGVHGMTEASGALELPAGNHAVRVDYFQDSSAGGLIMQIAGPGLTKQIVPAALWLAPGVTAKYYDLVRAQASVPNFAALQPYTSDRLAEINFPGADGFFATSGRNTWVGAVLRGYLLAETDGIYQLSVESDDGTKLYVGNQLLINNDGPHGMLEVSGAIGLQAGYHEIKIEFYQGDGGAGLIARYQPPGEPKQVIPASAWALPLGSDCDNDGVADTAQAESRLSLADLLINGDGDAGGSAIGVCASNGQLSPAGAGGCTLANLPSSFTVTDGSGGSADLEYVDGVFVPRGATVISSTGLSRLFSQTGGNTFDAIRDGAFGNNPILIPQQPGAGSSGIGIHPNAGVTFDLDAIRPLVGGRPLLRVEALAAINLSAIASNNPLEAWILVDGVVRERALLAGTARRFQPMAVELADTDRFLTLATTDAGATDFDHAVFANAYLIAASAADTDGDGQLDACTPPCPADLTNDGIVDDSDLGLLLDGFTNQSSAGDIDGDGDTDDSDLGLLLDLFGKPCR